MPQHHTHDDMPRNPLEKRGYRLAFSDDFDGQALDESLWLPYYLPHWSSRERSSPRYTFADSALVLQITADQQPWCPEFDGEVKCSSIQTGHFAGPVGSAIGQHRFNKSSVVREATDNARTYTPQYGYFEIRAKAVAARANHVAFWLIGYEDAPERSAEIAVMEIMGATVTPESARAGYGLHPWGDPSIQDAFYEDEIAIDATCFHIYAAEWTPTHVDFYVDNVKTRTIPQSPSYPMQMMLSIYERPLQPAPDDPYPKSFVVDYVRVYQPEAGYPSA